MPTARHCDFYIDLYLTSRDITERYLAPSLLINEKKIQVTIKLF